MESRPFAVLRCVPARPDCAAVSKPGASSMKGKAMKESAREAVPEQLALTDYSSAISVDGFEVRPRPAKPPRAHDKLQFILGPLGPRLRGHAERQGIAMAVLVRRAILRLLDADGAPGSLPVDREPFEHSASNVHFHLNLPAACSAELTARARAADMTRGEFVWWLLKGISPVALPPDHEAAVQALRASTDRIAALSTDISEFLRILSRSTTAKAELAPYRDSILGLDGAVREHLKVASVLIQELKPYRRARW
jgi:hypothetical protein